MIIRCAILDDHRVVRDGLTLLLNSEAGIEVVGSCASRDALVEIVRDYEPDILITDLDVPGCDAFDASEDARCEQPELKVIALTAYPTDNNISRAVSCGFAGFLTKSEPAEFIIEAIKNVMKGEHVYSDAVRSRMLGSIAEPKASILTPRELAVIALAAQGCTTKVIGEKLGRSPKTIESHLTNAMRKLDVRSRVDLVRWAIREGVVQP
ncbi:MAG: response regulator [Phycisphaerales bacterium JB061]